MLTALRFTELAVALLVLGEAAALGYGMGLLSGSSNPWATTINLLLLLSDVLLGGVLTYFTVSSKETDTVVVIAAAGIAVTHAYRAIEYFLPVLNPFCFSIWLFLVNGLKLIGAVAIIVLVFKTRD